MRDYRPDHRHATSGRDETAGELLEWRAAIELAANKWRITMKNPLDSIWGTIISGLVLTAILYYVVKSILM